MNDVHDPIIDAYSANAKVLAEKYAAYDRSKIFPGLADFLTLQHQRILDIGAGQGIDAKVPEREKENLSLLIFKNFQT